MKAGKWLLAFAAAVAAGGLIVQAEGEQPKGESPAAIVKPIASEPDALPPPLETQPVSGKPQQKPAEATSRTPKPDTHSSLPAWAAANLPDRTIRNNDDGLAVITNASSRYVLVNKTRNLPSSYVPKDLVVPDVPFSFSGDSPKKQLRKDAAAALEKLFAGSERAGFALKAVSGYRAYATQKAIFDRNASQKGEEAANRTSAHPGQSEHQTGLAMDISSAAVGYALEDSFGDTEEGRWLSAHAGDYGFIIRYPKGKEDITGYAYEPWHVRYIGKEAAVDIADRELTLEQFFDTLEAFVAN